MAEGDSTDVLRRLDRLVWRLDALDEWRTKVDGRLSVLESEVLTVREGRIVEETLRRQRSAHQRIALTVWQRAGAVVLVSVSLGDLMWRVFGS